MFKGRIGLNDIVIYSPTPAFSLLVINWISWKHLHQE